MKKEIQEKERNQNTIGRSRERKKEFLERERLWNLFWKNNRKNPSNYPRLIYKENLKIQ